MAVTILGKRFRASDEDASIISCRVKRRTIVSIVEEDKENDSILHADNLDLVSPVKCASLVEDINNENTIPTPNTPRHRDSLSKKCPVTPRHRVLVGGKSNTPRTPRTPTTPSAFAKSVFNDAKKVFTRGADAGQLIGRCKEKEELESFVKTCIDNKKGGCLYVSGPPGTGKSAFVTQICTNLKAEQATNYAYINCMSVKSATELYDLMAADLAMDDAVCQGFSKDALQTTFTKADNDICLVVLDEIDQLLSLDNSTLCSFFEWSFAKDSRLVLIGIANALDLTDRFLPRVKAKNLKPALLPFLPYTAPQVASVLSSRARSLLPPEATVAADFTPFLHPTAITLISKKVASQTGDLRKAFDMAFHAIELVETETKDKMMKEALQAQQEQQPEPALPTRVPLSESISLNNTNNAPSSPPPSANSTPKAAHSSTPSISTSLTNLTTISAPRATLAHIVRVTTSTQSASSATARLKTLNLHQKAILCSLVALEAQLLSLNQSATTTTNMTPLKAKSAQSSLPSPATPTQRKLFTPIASSTPAKGTATSAPTLRTLYATYTALCSRDNLLHALSSTEFRDVVANLETMSLVTAADATAKTSSSGGHGGLFASSITGMPSRSGRGKGKNATVVPVDERKVKAMVGIKDMEGAVEGVGAGLLRGMLKGEILGY